MSNPYFMKSRVINFEIFNHELKEIVRVVNISYS